MIKYIVTILKSLLEWVWACVCRQTQVFMPVQDSRPRSGSDSEALIPCCHSAQKPSVPSKNQTGMLVRFCAQTKKSNHSTRLFSMGTF